MPLPMTQTRRTAVRMLEELSEDSLSSAMDYIAFLRSIEEREDKEDIVCYLERRVEPTIPLAEVRKKLGLS